MMSLKVTNMKLSRTQTEIHAKIQESTSENMITVEDRLQRLGIWLIISEFTQKRNHLCAEIVKRSLVKSAIWRDTLNWMVVLNNIRIFSHNSISFKIRQWPNFYKCIWSWRNRKLFMLKILKEFFYRNHK